MTLKKLRRMKFEKLISSILLIYFFISEISAAGLFLTRNSTNSEVGRQFLVACKDKNSGSGVVWKGPDGKEITENTQPRMQIRPYGYALVFDRIKKEDQGIYTCSSGKEEVKFTLNVGEKLRFIRTEERMSFPEGTSGSLPCEALGGKVSWTVNGTVVDGKDGKYEVGGDGLIIKNLTKEDENEEYNCSVTSEITGNRLNKNIKLIVLRKPTLPPNFEEQNYVYGVPNQYINLTCEVDSQPPATYMWSFKQLKPKAFVIFNETLPNGYRSVLRLYMNKAATDDYTCEAKNDHGDLKVHYSVAYGIKPDPPKSYEKLEVHGDGMTLKIEPPDDNAEIPALFAPIGFQVQYRVFENKSDEEEKSEIVTKNPVKKGPIRHGWSCCWQDFDFSEDGTYRLTGLEPETQYEIQVATRNKAGTSDFIQNENEIIETISGATTTKANRWANAFVFSISTLLMGSGYTFLVPVL